MITAGRLASRWLACGSPIVNVPQSQRAGSGAPRVARVADVVRVAPREQDDIAAAHALDMRVAVDPEREFAFVDDVQGAGVGEADRERPRRSVRNDPFSAQTDTPQQLREQVVRLTGDVEAERGVLGSWTIGKIFRRNGHCPSQFLRLRSTNGHATNHRTADTQSTRRGAEP